MPDAADVSVEFPSARVPADRENRLGQVPLLQRRVHTTALSARRRAVSTACRISLPRCVNRAQG